MKRRVLAALCMVVVLAGVFAYGKIRTCSIEGPGGSSMNTVTQTVNV